MILTFLNSEINLCISECFNELSPRFQVQLADKFQANPDDTFQQSIEVSKEDLVVIYKSCSSIPEGIINKSNSQIKQKLLPLLSSLAQQGDADALYVISKIQEIDKNNDDIRISKMALGKSYLQNV